MILRERKTDNREGILLLAMLVLTVNAVAHLGRHMAVADSRAYKYGRLGSFALWCLILSVSPFLGCDFWPSFLWC